jgi:hypothetical protein
LKSDDEAAVKEWQACDYSIEITLEMAKAGKGEYLFGFFPFFLF